MTLGDLEKAQFFQRISTLALVPFDQQWLNSVDNPTRGRGAFVMDQGRPFLRGEAQIRGLIPTYDHTFWEWPNDAGVHRYVIRFINRIFRIYFWR